MAGDWIKLHRKLLKSAVFEDAVTLKVWIAILLEANWEERQLITGQILKPGELVISQRKFALTHGLSRQTLRTHLERLVLCGNVVEKPTHRGTHLSICNWESYQVRNVAVQPSPNPPESAPYATAVTHTAKTAPTNQPSPNPVASRYSHMPCDTHKTSNGRHLTHKSTQSQPSPNPVPTQEEEKKEVQEASPRRLRYADEDMVVAKWMFSLIQKILPNAKTPPWTKWANTIRLMREQDGRTHAEIRDVFRRANQDDFWRANVLSPEKLRKQLGNGLELKLKRPPKQEPTSSPLPPLVNP